MVRWSGGQVVRWSGGQVVRWSGGQVVRVVNLVSLDDMLSENIGFSCPKSSNNWEKLRCYACDINTYIRKVESRAVFCLSRIRKNTTPDVEAALLAGGPTT